MSQVHVSKSIGLRSRVVDVLISSPVPKVSSHIDWSDHPVDDSNDGGSCGDKMGELVANNYDDKSKLDYKKSKNRLESK